MADLWFYGTSKWARLNKLQEKGYIGGDGLTFGYFIPETTKKGDYKPYQPVRYNGDAHMLTVAPTRSGKGTCQIIPALMDHAGAVLCIDPKGENAIITAEAREKLHGQKVHILDPWGLFCAGTGHSTVQPFGHDCP